MLVEQFLESSARRTPDKVALVCDDRRLTYREIDALADRLAASLVELGLAPGDRVVIHLDNSVEAVVAVFAVLKANGVFVVVNPTTKAEKLAYLVSDCRAAVLISDGRRGAVVSPAHVSCASLRSVVFVGESRVSSSRADCPVVALDTLLAAAPAGERPRCRRIDVDVAAIVYTSGSTGQPKGVVLTHLNVVSAATSITTYLENTPDDVILDVLPLSFDYGLYQVLMAFKVGARIVLTRSFTYPHDVLRIVANERVTGFPIVPTLSAILLRFDLPAYDLSSLRYITNTGAALPTSHITQLRAQLPLVKIYSMYGLTECKRVAYLPPQELERRPASVGKAMPNVEVFLVDEEGRRVDEGVGELVVRGSNVMRGYWERPEDTERTLRPGAFVGQKVLYSGDLFRVDTEGFLYFLGRKDDIIKSRGEKVSPKEVENVLHDLAGVDEAAVIGVPDSVLGQAVKAFVALQAGAALTEQDVLHHCAQRLEDFMVPRAVEFLASMPRTSTGKIDRRRLANPLAG